MSTAGTKPEGNDEVVSKGRCPRVECDTGDTSYVTYADGHTYCFSCKKASYPADKAAAGGRVAGERAGSLAKAGTSGDDRWLVDQPVKSSPLIEPPARCQPLQSRRLTAATTSRYGYFTTVFKKDSGAEVAPYYDQAGELCAQKVRLANKEFVVLYKEGAARGAISECRPFGWHVWGDKHDRRVVITEGELDAMSVAQETEFKYPCVSVVGGAASAARCLKKNYLWLDRFSEIVLWFDTDQAGQDAANECASLFKIGKVKIAKAPGSFKDASDLLQANRAGDIAQAIFMAPTWRPAGIVNASSNSDDVKAEVEDESSFAFSWPWPQMNVMFGPMRPGQVVYHVAGTGIGKTTAVAEIEVHLKSQGCKIGHLGFEDTRREVKLRLMGIAHSTNYETKPLADDKMVKLHDEFFGDGNVELFDPASAEWTFDAVLGYIRFMVKALGCQVVLVDPLTFIAGLLGVGDDMQKALSGAATQLALISKELGVHIQVTHHLTEPRNGSVALTEGGQTSVNQVRGSGAIADFAVIIIGHERDQQAAGDLALITQLRSLKNRPRSKTGPILTLRYDPVTGRLKPMGDAFPGPHSSKGNRGGDTPAPAFSDF